MDSALKIHLVAMSMHLEAVIDNEVEIDPMLLLKLVYKAIATE